MADLAARSLAERCGLVGDRARPERDTRRRTTRWRQAKRRQTAGIEALD
jgi:hypothetical protein